MATLDELVNAALAQGAQMNPQSLADQIYAGQAQDVNRQAGNAAQTINENTFGRGLGLSTISGYLQGQNELARATALAKAREQAMLASSEAQRSALGQAAGQVTNNLNRQAQEANVRRQLGQQRSIANDQMLAGGLGSLVNTGAGLTGLVFGQDIRRGLHNLVGGGQKGLPAPGQPVGTSTGQSLGGGGTGVPLPASAGGTPFSTPAPSTFTMPDISMPDLTTLSGGGGWSAADYMPDYSSAFDTSWLSSPTDYSLDTTPAWSYPDWQIQDFSGANLNDLLGFYPGL